jgi:hypothetical protein
VKKIVCPQCGAINLEKFVTFPNCAGCSALLPLAREPARASIWRRPLRVGFWASLVGVALAGVMALSFSAAEPNDPAHLVLYAQASRQISLDGVLVCSLSLEAVRADGRDAGALREVAWQVARRVERDWIVVSVSPRPDSRSERGVKVAWIYSQWPSEERWVLRLRPRARGRHAIAISANAPGHFPVQWKANVTVR